MTVRPVRPSDYAGINRLHRAVWWPERSQAGWRWLEQNPARIRLDAPSGWVVEDADGEPAAFLGNFVQAFWHGDRRLHGSTGFSTIVPTAVKGSSRHLFKALLRQPDMVAHYTLNANRRSAPLYRLFGLKAWPEQTHALKLSWIVDRWAVLRGRILREIVTHASSLIAHRTERFVTRRLWATPILNLPPDIQVLSDMSETSPYAAFWTARRAEGDLLADRSPETMRWRLADPDRTLDPVILAHVSQGRITGYVLAQMSKGSSIEPAFLEIVDLLALADAPDAIPALTRALIANARALGAAKVRLQMVSPRLLDCLGPLAGSARREGGWGHAHVRFADPTLADAWSPTPFDGDYGICLRPVPERRVLGIRNRAPDFVADKASA